MPELVRVHDVGLRAAHEHWLSVFNRTRLPGMLDRDDLLESYRETWVGKPNPSVAQQIADYETCLTKRMARA